MGGATAPGFPAARRATGEALKSGSDEGEAPHGGTARSADYLDRRGMGKQERRKNHSAGVYAMVANSVSNDGAFPPGSREQPNE